MIVNNDKNQQQIETKRLVKFLPLLYFTVLLNAEQQLNRFGKMRDNQYI